MMGDRTLLLSVSLLMLPGLAFSPGAQSPSFLSFYAVVGSFLQAPERWLGALW